MFRGMPRTAMTHDENIEAVKDLVRWHAQARGTRSAKLSQDFTFGDRGQVIALEDYRGSVGVFAGSFGPYILEDRDRRYVTVAVLYEATDRLRPSAFARPGSFDLPATRSSR